MDLDTGAVVAVQAHPGDRGDSQSPPTTLQQAQDNLVRIRQGPATQGPTSRVEELVGDKGYHSNQTLLECKRRKLRTYLAEPQRGRRRWKGKRAAQQAVYQNRRRIRNRRGKQLLRRRGELLERPFHHRLELGGMRRTHLRGQANLQKREYVAASAQNLGLLMRHQHRLGTPRRLQDLRRPMHGCFHTPRRHAARL